MASVDLKVDVPHSARVYDYLLGGKDNFQADRDAAEVMRQHVPAMPISMRANRDFMVRSAHFLAADLGIRQFLDIGAGLPTSPNMHEVVQRVDPRSRVIYVDNDPIVLAHARALLTSAPEGRTAYLDADLRDARRIMTDPQLTSVFDLDRPVAVSLIAILQFVIDEELTHQIIDELMAPLAPGSALAISTVTTDVQTEGTTQVVATYNARGMVQKSRNRTEVVQLFDGFDLLEPGVVLVHRWRPDPAAAPVDDTNVFMYGGVGVKR